MTTQWRRKRDVPLTCLYCGRPADPYSNKHRDPFQRWWYRGVHLGCLFGAVYAEPILKMLEQEFKFGMDEWEEVIKCTKESATKEPSRQISFSIKQLQDDT